jgi:hypothetical protein
MRRFASADRRLGDVLKRVPLPRCRSSATRRRLGLQGRLTPDAKREIHDQFVAGDRGERLMKDVQSEINSSSLLFAGLEPGLKRTGGLFEDSEWWYLFPASPLRLERTETPDGEVPPGRSLIEIASATRSMLVARHRGLPIEASEAPSRRAPTKVPPSTASPRYMYAGERPPLWSP